MQVNRVKVHNYLGVKLDYTTIGQVNITMLDYINEIIDTFDKVNRTGDGTNPSDAPAIFKVI